MYTVSEHLSIKHLLITKGLITKYLHMQRPPQPVNKPKSASDGQSDVRFPTRSPEDVSSAVGVPEKQNIYTEP